MDPLNATPPLRWAVLITDLNPTVGHKLGYLTDPSLRERVRRALARHLGLAIPADVDGASGDYSFQP